MLYFFVLLRSDNISILNKYAKRLGKTDVQEPLGDPILEIRTIRALLFLRNLVSVLCSSFVVYSGNADILEQFNISRRAVRQTRCPPRLPFSRCSLPIYISYFCATSLLPVLFVLKKRNV